MGGAASGLVAVLVAAASGCASSGGRSAPRPESAPLVVPKLDGGGASSPAAGVRFRRTPPAVGARYRVSVQADSRAPDPQGGEQLSSYVSELTVEVLALDGPAPSRVRLRFARNVHAFQGRDTPTEIDGKTYVVEKAAPQVRDERGAAASEIESQRVLDVFPNLGTRGRVDEVLPDDPMTIGDRRDELAGAVLGIIHPRAWTLVRGTAALARVDADDAIFDVTLVATSQTGVSMNVKGEARVRLRDSALAGLSLSGSYRVAGDDTGSFTLRRALSDYAGDRCIDLRFARPVGRAARIPVNTNRSDHGSDGSGSAQLGCALAPRSTRQRKSQPKTCSRIHRRAKSTSRQPSARNGPSGRRAPSRPGRSSAAMGSSPSSARASSSPAAARSLSSAISAWTLSGTS